MAACVGHCPRTMYSCPTDGDPSIALTASIFDAMSNYSIDLANQRAVNVFLDTQRLQKGELFDEAFARALTHTTIVVPIVSVDALTKMLENDGTWVDNVLLEWILSMETLSAASTGGNGNSGGVKAIYPIFLGDVTVSPETSSTEVGAFSSSDIKDKLPDVVPAATIAAPGAPGQ